MKSPLTINEIMNAKRPIPDPEGLAGVLRWDVPGNFRGGKRNLGIGISSRKRNYLSFQF
jgi:hypothetical protein